MADASSLGASSSTGTGAGAFLEKLYGILDDPQNSEYIQWSQEGQSILIKNCDAFAAHVLGRYFKHSNFQSFVRQLNMYSFNKTRHDSDHWEFRQKNFQQGKRHLLHEVKRKTRNLAGTQPRSKLEALLADMSQLKANVLAAKGRLGAVEGRLLDTSEKCNLIQAENQSLWRILMEASPPPRANNAAATQQQPGSPPGLPPGMATAPLGASVYCGHFAQLHVALESIPMHEILQPADPTLHQGSVLAHQGTKAEVPGAPLPPVPVAMEGRGGGTQKAAQQAGQQVAQQVAQQRVTGAQDPAHGAGVSEPAPKRAKAGVPETTAV